MDWLEDHRLLNIALILTYFVFIYYMHDPVVHLSVWVMNLMSLPVYNLVVLSISLILLVLFVIFMIVQLIKYRDHRSLKIAYLLFTITIIIIHFLTMFEMNIEIIHVFEYSILVLLIFPVTRRFGASILFALPFMLLDEWHQYIILYPSYVEYFEFNDIMMDIYGSGLTMVAIIISGVKGQEPVQAFWKRSEFIFLTAALVFVAIAINTCFISMYEADKCSNTWLVLNRIHGPITFWRSFPNRDVIYHVMQPLEAIISISVLTCIYFGLDSFRKAK